MPSQHTSFGHMPSHHTSLGHMPSHHTSLERMPSHHTSFGHMPSHHTSLERMPSHHHERGLVMEPNPKLNTSPSPSPSSSTSQHSVVTVSRVVGSTRRWSGLMYCVFLACWLSALALSYLTRYTGPLHRPELMACSLAPNPSSL